MKTLTLFSLIRRCVAAFAVLLTCVAFPAHGITTNDFGAQHSVKVLTQHGYLPGIPVLVRVELRNAAGPERELWNADATLSADDPGVTLSTNRVLLRNGLGSALVALSRWDGLQADGHGRRVASDAVARVTNKRCGHERRRFTGRLKRLERSRSRDE